MPTFSVSISEEECAPIDEDARRNQRSRSAQVRYVLAKWYEEREALKEREKELKK